MRLRPFLRVTYCGLEFAGLSSNRLSSAGNFRSHKAVKHVQEIEIQDRESLPGKERNDILNDKSGSKKYAQKEWWKMPDARDQMVTEKTTIYL